MNREPSMESAVYAAPHDDYQSSEQLYHIPPNHEPESKLLEQFKTAAQMINLELPDNFHFSCNYESLEILESLMTKILELAAHGQNREEMEGLALKFYFSLTKTVPKLSRRAAIRQLFRQIFR